MIKTYAELLLEYSNYSNAKMKIARLEKEGKIYKVKRGLYETNRRVDPWKLASAIYGPSYISFQAALAFYGLIPERVNLIMSATALKNKTKKFNNQFGSYYYKDIPCKAFGVGIVDYGDNEYSFLIASKEKAICDTLYTISPVDNRKDIEYLLFDDLRINEDLFEELDFQTLISIAPLYNSKNLDLLEKYVKRHWLKQSEV